MMQTKHKMHSTSQITFGIIGMGRFGKLWAELLSPYGKVIFYDKNFSHKTYQNKNIKSENLKSVCKAHIIFLSIPISQFEKCCKKIKPFLDKNSLVVDCCSVKMHPANIMQNIFAQTQPIVASHPLFGPDSVKKSGGIKNHKMVICPIQHVKNNAYYLLLNTILRKMKVKIIISTSSHHDQQMANSQGLVHFIGRGLKALHLKPQPLATPDYQALCHINQMVENDSWQLFFDMHRYNPYTQKIRLHFIKKLNELNEKIENQPYQDNHFHKNTLEILRKEIENIDAQIIAQLAKRQKAAIQIGQLKLKTHQKIKDTHREKLLMDYYKILSKQHRVNPDFIQQIFQKVIQYSRRLQK